MAGGSRKKRIIRSTTRPAPSMAPHPMTNTLLPSYRSKCERRVLPLVLGLLSVLALFHVTSKTAFRVSSQQLYSFVVVNEFPHDPGAFTQGLVYGGNDTLFESTGLYGQSSVRQVHLQTGQIQALHEMNRSYFGEGLTLLGERLFQVMWMTNTGFVYNRSNLTKLGMFTHDMKDGWGLATDGKVIFGSDGTSTLYTINSKTMKVLGKATVTSNGYQVSRLNELEYINGEVWANVWMSDCIARISPRDGIVRGWILLQNLRQGLLSSVPTDIDCLNGIAWDEEKKRLFVTGKLWPKLYEIEVQPVKTHLQGSVEDLCLSRYWS
ncbi:glutaminyl-peptide cyclotransferase-like [Aristolochia californica]|uniref:glutaminyl-peptide cyclotransferase-like n=1 Tax=Aristolochia californica TaxID=171875 RepID=UPI0035E08F16